MPKTKRKQAKPRSKNVVRKRVAPKVEIPLEDHESDLIKRISDCELIVNELDNSSIWKIIHADLELQRQNLDDRWHELVDPIKVQEARILKFATMHILSLKDKYKEELEALQEQLKAWRGKGAAVIKDYDGE